jgi:hypothetical protein
MKRLRKITSLRSLNKEIKAAQCEPAVRIRAYRNGEGIRDKPPVLVIGSTIDSVSFEKGYDDKNFVSCHLKERLESVRKTFLQLLQMLFSSRNIFTKIVIHH